MKKIILLILCFISIVAIAKQPKRVALVIGNEKYSGHFSALHTPVNDAEAMTIMLSKLGFETVLLEKNVSRESFKTYLRQFKEYANGADLALFYYSGHAGIHIDKSKQEHFYLAPSGSYDSQATLIDDCYPFSSVEKEINGIGAPTKIFIIDACRSSIDDNKSMVPNFYSTNSITENTRVRGTIYFYATGVNKTAQTGNGKFSLFTASLLNHLDDSVNFSTVIERVQNDVIRANRDQNPICENKDIASRIYFNPNKINIYYDVINGKDKYTITTIPSDAAISFGNKTYHNGATFIVDYGKEYYFTVSKEGFASVKDTIRATPYKTQSTIVLDKLAKATVSIYSNKKDVNVFFDSKPVGKAPVFSMDTYAGTHSIRGERRGYYTSDAKINLSGGHQRYDIKMRRSYPWFWDFDDDGLNIVNYHYSPQYPIGLSLLYRPEWIRWSFGAIIGVSTGLFRNLGNDIEIIQNERTYTETNDDVTTNYYLVDGVTLPYSSYVDPNNDAKHYDASALILGNVGYNPCNGILLEFGIGAGFHQDRYYMDETYFIQETTQTNNVTGDVNNYPTIYIKKDDSHWYRENKKWSPALRLGTKFFIPLLYDKSFMITLGAGYTFLPTNFKYSDLDVNAGVAWTF